MIATYLLMVPLALARLVQSGPTQTHTHTRRGLDNKQNRDRERERESKTQGEDCPVGASKTSQLGHLLLPNRAPLMLSFFAEAYSV